MVGWGRDGNKVMLNDQCPRAAIAELVQCGYSTYCRPSGPSASSIFHQIGALPNFFLNVVEIPLGKFLLMEFISPIIEALDVGRKLLA